jgi:uncharacterized protein (TIGR03118 family)
VNIRRKTKKVCFCALSVFAALSSMAQSNNYRQVNLVSGVAGLGLTVDPSMHRPWGLAISTGQPIRVTNNKAGSFRSYDATGRSLMFAGNVALPVGSTAARSNPAGIAANSTGLFAPHGSLASPFLFATEDGTISGEYADTQGNILASTILAIDNSSRGAVYTGIAVLTPGCCSPLLAVADFHGGFIDTFTGTFDPLSPPGTFTDPNLPARYAPYNLNIVGDQVFVAYALQNAAADAPTLGAGNGIVDVYDLSGTFVRRFVSNGVLNAPWGIVKASENFGAFSGDILIGNAGDGAINAFDSVTGAFLGQLKDGNGNAIVNPDLHGMVFGDGVAGERNTLYIASGLSGASLFGAISDNTGGVAPDFTLTASPSAADVHQGEAATFTLTATPAGSLRGLFTFSCISPSGTTCSVGSTAVDATTGAARVSIETSTSPAGLTQFAAIGLPGIFVGIGLLRRKQRSHRRSAIFASIFVFTALFFGLLGMVACGGTQISNSTRTFPIVVTANTQSISHSTTLTLTVR